MRSLVIFTATFLAALAGLVVLDRQGHLPQLAAGTSAATTKKQPPARWYTIERPFAVSTRDGSSARFTVAVELPERLPAFVRDGDDTRRLEQEPVIRALVTDTVMEHAAGALGSSAGRREMEGMLRRRIRAHTDVRVRRVVLSDVIVGG